MTPADDANVPSFANINSGLYCHQRNVLSLNPRTRQDVNLEGIWTEITDACVWTMVKKKIFLSTLDKIQKVETLFMDITFYIYPSLWCQLYSVHCLLDDVMCHVAYALVPLKSKETYVRLFTLINAAAHTRIGTKRAPRVIQTDFEVAAIQAAQEVFPGADIRGYVYLFFLTS